MADENLIRQVLINLIKNAAEACKNPSNITTKIYQYIDYFFTGYR